MEARTTPCLSRSRLRPALSKTGAVLLRDYKYSSTSGECCIPVLVQKLSCTCLSLHFPRSKGDAFAALARATVLSTRWTAYNHRIVCVLYRVVENAAEIPDPKLLSRIKLVLPTAHPPLRPSNRVGHALLLEENNTEYREEWRHDP